MTRWERHGANGRMAELGEGRLEYGVLKTRHAIRAARSSEARRGEAKDERAEGSTMEKRQWVGSFLLALGLLAAGLLAAPAKTYGQIGVGISVTIAPPELPVYEQPICPGDGYLWTPGYWAYGDDGYYWVPGTWVEAPEVGFLWTPAYWGWGGSAFIFHEGYWGPTIGFYGGINYGFGYFGHGFEGGRWDNGHFFYNRAVSNVNVTVIHNVYETRVV